MISEIAGSSGEVPDFKRPSCPVPARPPSDRGAWHQILRSTLKGRHNARIAKLGRKGAARSRKIRNRGQENEHPERFRRAA